MAETELDGVADAAKAPIVAAIKAAKDKINAGKLGFDKPKYTRKLDRAMREAEEAIGNLATWNGAENLYNEVANDPAAQAVIGPELAAAAKKFATFKKLNKRKASVQLLAQFDTNVQTVEQEWKESKPKIAGPDATPNDRDFAVDKMSRYLADVRKRINDQLAPDDNGTKALLARLDKVSEEFTQLALADQVKEVVATLKRQIDLYKNDWEGYEAETAGPTFEDYRKKQSEKMSRFYAPKTVIFVSRTDAFLANLATDKDYQAVAGDKTVKGIIDDITAKRNAAAAKLVKFVSDVVDAAEKAPIKDTNAFDRLQDDVRLALGQNSPEGIAMQARLKKKTDAHIAETTGAEEAKAKLIVTLRAKAEEAWPKLYDGMTWINEIDLSNPAKLNGKNIGFLSDNLMGYRFKPGDFYYATTIGGIPVAAKFDPLLKKQIDATEKAIGRGIGDDDNDGQWDIIAVVTDKKAKLLAKREAESKGKVNGADVTVKTEYAEPVDAVVIEIIAAKCGPFAGVKDKGVLKVDGTIGK